MRNVTPFKFITIYKLYILTNNGIINDPQLRPVSRPDWAFEHTITDYRN